MAIRFAKQNGNWSSASTWDDGLTIPTASDDVYLNGFNITVDQDVTVLSISNSPTPIGVPVSIIPNMTGKTTPTGVGQAFANQNDANAWLSFRKPPSMPSTVGWVANSRPAGIGYLYDTSKIIKRYAWRQNSDTNRRPSNWTFEGSNDGVTWFVLDTVVGSSVATYYSSVLANTTPYTYYRINVSVTNGSNQPPSFDYIDMTESTSTATGWASGGTATISTARTVNADLYNGAATNLIVISAASPNIVSMTGNMPGTRAVGNSTVIAVTGNCTLNYVGNVAGAFGIGGQLPNARGIVLSAAATINVTGDVYGGSNTHDNFVGSECLGIASSTGATINVVGNVTGGTGVGNRGIQGSNNDTINVTGNVRSGTGVSSSFSVPLRGIWLSGTSTVPCSIVGNIIGDTNGYAIQSTASHPVKITGNIQNHSSGRMSVLATFLFLDSTNMQWEFRKYNLTTNTLYTPGVNTGHPAESNVRTGIVYGPTNNLTGTCAVPPAGAVSLGVPVDNTTGTAYLSGNDISAAVWDTQTTSLSATGSIGERLKNASTVDTTAATVAAYDI